MNQAEALAEIGQAIQKHPKQHRHLSDLIDRVLDIDTAVPDDQLDAEWEKNRGR